MLGAGRARKQQPHELLQASDFTLSRLPLALRVGEALALRLGGGQRFGVPRYGRAQHLGV